MCMQQCACAVYVVLPCLMTDFHKHLLYSYCLNTSHIAITIKDIITLSKGLKFKTIGFKYSISHRRGAAIQTTGLAE